MKITRILLIVILVLTGALFANIWTSPDGALIQDIEESLLFAGNISDEEKQAYIIKILDKSGALRCELVFDY